MEGGFMSWIHPLEPRLLLASFMVTNTNDSGAGSLRDAMQKAEDNADDFNVIDFTLPGTGVRTINLSSGLPIQSKQLYINGLAANGKPLIELNGGFRQFSSVCFQFDRIVGDSGNKNLSLITDLIIHGFKSDAVDIFNDGLTEFVDCFIGTNSAGTATSGFGNGGDGVLIESNRTVFLEQDVISGNQRGVAILGGASDITITGCRIGTNYLGTAA